MKRNETDTVRCAVGANVDVLQSKDDVNAQMHNCAEEGLQHKTENAYANRSSSADKQYIAAKIMHTRGTASTK